jgi:16S rRNA (uracil1498-N3)-methyltransferase
MGRRYRVEGRAYEALKLWRPRPGEALTIAGASGVLWRARVVRLGPTDAEVVVFEEAGEESGGPMVTLLQALPEKERMELVIQKTTELGVDAIVPFKSSRSTSLEERDSMQRKSHKWQEAALRASRQSRRASIPVVSGYCGFSEALASARDAHLKLMLLERVGMMGIKDALKETSTVMPGAVAVVSGPEGGFTDAEADEARMAGFVPISLGVRILRAETASILAIGLIRYELG